MTIKVYNGDCAEVMTQLESDSVDAIVTDPPYGLAFMGAKWDTFGRDKQYGNDSMEVRRKKALDYATTNKGAPRYGNGHGPGKLTAAEALAFQNAMTPIFKEAIRVAKPGAHLLCFGGTRTFHRMTCAIEDAGWEVRETIMWVYGSGFPKSMDVAKAIDKASGYVGEVIGERTVDVGMQGGHMHAGRKQQQQQVFSLSPQAKEWQGWGTCLKPAWEPIIVARKPLDGTVAHNVLTWGTGAINIDACRVAYESDADRDSARPQGEATSKAAGHLAGGGDFDVKRKSFDVVQKEGRFPANLVHDGSEEVVRLFPQSNGQQADVTGNEPSHPADGVCYGEYNGRHSFAKRGDTGSAARFFNTLRDGEESADRTYADKGSTNFAAKPGMRREPVTADRFFYCAKASKKDRGEGNDHPTVKPNALMRWLVRLVCPRGGTVMDPFMGSGSTGLACIDEGMDFIGIEREKHYVEIAEKRFDGRQLSLDLEDLEG